MVWWCSSCSRSMRGNGPSRHVSPKNVAATFRDEPPLAKIFSRSMLSSCSVCSVAAAAAVIAATLGVRSCCCCCCPKEGDRIFMFKMNICHLFYKITYLTFFYFCFLIKVNYIQYRVLVHYGNRFLKGCMREIWREAVLGNCCSCDP